METTSQGQQPAPAAPTPTPVTPVAVEPVELPFSPEAVAAALAQSKAPAAAQAEPAKEEVKTAEGVQTSGAEGTIPGTEGAIEDPDADLVIEGEENPPARILPNRISTKQFTETEQEAIALRRDLAESGETVSLKEAIEIVELRKAEKPVEQQQQQEQQVQDPIKALTDKRTELMTQRREVAEVDPFDPALVDLDNQIEVARDEIADARAEHKFLERQQQQQEQEQAAKSKQEVIDLREKSKQAALLEYPSAGDAASPLGREVNSLIAEMQVKTHEDHALLFAANAPHIVIEMAAKRIAERVSKARGVTVDQVMGSLKAKSTASPAPAAAAAPVTQARPPVRPVSGASSQAPVEQPLTGQAILDYVGFDPAKIAAARKGLGHFQNAAHVTG